MRTLFVYLHRWVGLFIAAFLVLSGLTGAVISWDHELDEWLNPHLTDAHTTGTALPVLDIIRDVEARYPTMEVSFAPLVSEPGHSLALFMVPKVNPSTGELYDATFNQVFIDPVSGDELGTREWGAVWPISRENFVSFLYVLHYSLHIPEFWGIDRWGIWLMGVIALIWTIDCFTGFYLTLPSRRRARREADDSLADDELPKVALPKAAKQTWWQRWKPAWKVRWRSGSYKLNFDLHRAFSLWTWGLLFVVAFTAFSLNLYREMFFPVMSLVSDVTPTVFDVRTPTPNNQPIAPQINFADALNQGEALAAERGWEEPVGSVFHSRNFGVYGVSFYRPEDGHGAGGVGHRTLYMDSEDGRDLGAYEPWKGTVADLFVQAQFPIHSGRILGLPGRILISVMGVVIAMLSITGVIIWWRKHKARATRRVKKVVAAPAWQ